MLHILGARSRSAKRWSSVSGSLRAVGVSNPLAVLTGVEEVGNTPLVHSTERSLESPEAVDQGSGSRSGRHPPGQWYMKRVTEIVAPYYFVQRTGSNRRIEHLEYASDGRPRWWGEAQARAAIEKANLASFRPLSMAKGWKA